MNFKPKISPEKFSLPIFLIDSLLYFVLASILAFMGPFVIAGFISRNSEKDSSLNQAMGNTIEPLYNGDDSMLNYQLVCIIPAIIIVVVSTVYRLKRYYLTGISIQNGLLIMIRQNLSGNIKEKSIPIRDQIIYYDFSKANEEKDAEVRIFIRKPKQWILSTDTDKYWNYRDNKSTILALIGELTKNCKELKNLSN